MLLTFNGRKLLKIIYNSLFAVGFLGLLWTMAIYNTYIDKLPRSLNAATGNIYSLNAHGIGVFQTLQERRHLDYVKDMWILGDQQSAGICVGIDR